jgi:lysophospholipase L1-like esterase
MSSWADNARYDPTRRWPNVMQSVLGEDWLVIAEGLPGRTTVHDDPVEGGHLSGLAYLRPCLESHRPLDLVVLMLGTNDFKRRFNLEAEDVAAGLHRLIVDTARLAVFGGKAPRILVICPPPIEVVGIFMTMFEGADRKSRQLASQLQDVARACGADFLDAGEIIRSSPIDGIHLDAEAQAALGQAAGTEALRMFPQGNRS